MKLVSRALNTIDRSATATNAAELGQGPCRGGAVSAAGFTLIELIAAVITMLIVMTAAWLLLVASNDNLDRVGNGSRASDDNRAALAWFERDLGHAMSPTGGLGASAVLVAADRECSFLADVDSDGLPELVTWRADDAGHDLVRSVKHVDPGSASSATPATAYSMETFAHSTETTTAVLTGLATGSDLDSAAQGGQRKLFAYAVSATDPGVQLSKFPGLIGLITLRLRNGAPDKDSNVVDRTGAFRVVSYVVNGY